jgi:hypothetical protein
MECKEELLQVHALENMPSAAQVNSIQIGMLNDNQFSRVF